MKLTLDVKSITQLEKKIRDASKKIQTVADTIIDKLLEIGEKEAEANILTGSAADGNIDIYVETVSVIGGGKLNMIGDDVAYQEFGYGLVGQSNKNPKQPPEYVQGNKKAWVYNDENGKPQWSHGMEAQMPMYKASKAMRLALPEIAEEIISGVLKID